MDPESIKSIFALFDCFEAIQYELSIAGLMYRQSNGIPYYLEFTIVMHNNDVRSYLCREVTQADLLQSFITSQRSVSKTIGNVFIGT